MILKQSFSTLLRSTEDEREDVEKDESSLSLSSSKTISSLDQKHVWHPYAPIPNSVPAFPVKSASGVQIELVDGRTLIDGMSSWWACIHGYNHPQLNAAAQTQIQNMSHIMFGGLTHPPAVQLAQKLVEITSLDHVFFSDSGSVSVEVAMKMALQYWYTLDVEKKHKFLTIKGGYHGDTFQAMSVCDPINGMHHMFSNTLPQQLFAERPTIPFHATDTWKEDDISSLKSMLIANKGEIAAIILEPIVQGAGGMYFYHPQYLKRVRELCDEHNVLLIVDEIATGFGRTGKLFACEHAGITPDIMCIGKALSGGFISFAATLTTNHISEVFNNNSKSNGSNVLMHGPTFMGNPLACAVSLESINMLQSYDWQNKVQEIEYQLKTELIEPCMSSPDVYDVRVLGAIGVIEMKEPMDMKTIQPQIVNEYGVWLRPFGKLLYTMPPFIMKSNELRQITNAMVSIATRGRLKR